MKHKHKKRNKKKFAFCNKKLFASTDVTSYHINLID